MGVAQRTGIISLGRLGSHTGFSRTTMIFFGNNSLRNAVKESCLHYHQERNHQGLSNRLIDPGDDVGCSAGQVACRERMGGMLRYYYRDAA